MSPRSELRYNKHTARTSGDFFEKREAHRDLRRPVQPPRYISSNSHERRRNVDTFVGRGLNWIRSMIQ